MLGTELLALLRWAVRARCRDPLHSAARTWMLACHQKNTGRLCGSLPASHGTKGTWTHAADASPPTDATRRTLTATSYSTDPLTLLCRRTWEEALEACCPAAMFDPGRSVPTIRNPVERCSSCISPHARQKHGCAIGLSEVIPLSSTWGHVSRSAAGPDGKGGAGVGAALALARAHSCLNLPVTSSR